MTPSAWRPSAHRKQLALRAALLAATRNFFAARSVLEVETPLLVNAGVTDINLRPVPLVIDGREMFLQTSPEYAMKRLLAAGSGDIYQLCRVVRGDERSRLHNPEFTLLEWYRSGLGFDDLIDEVAALLDTLAITAGRHNRPLRKTSYREAFAQALAIDPLVISLPALATLAMDHGLDREAAASLGRDELLVFLMAVVIGPSLGKNEWLAVTRYPASQAALARLDPVDSRVALRFEIYADGIELANGFEELADAAEQRARFNRDNLERAARGLPEIAIDERLLAALEAGLPHCSGVAVGFDRAVMVASGADRIDEIMAFPIEIA
ncbi:MAG: EF-P lysine aminoacylase GenX [Gammaproteobacteria bacterium]|nr:EF-P lysine aminoacylase GenX [Gammaproteobacteria bacterium]